MDITEGLETPPPLPLPSLHTHPLYLPNFLQNEKKLFVSSLVLTDNLKNILTLSSPPTFENPDNILFRPHTNELLEQQNTNIEKQYPINRYNNITDFTNPIIDHQIEHSNELSLNSSIVNIQPQHQAEYICKVQATEFDLSLDSAVNQDIIDTILPENVLTAEDKTVPKAIYICSKPALVAVELGSNNNSIDNTVTLNAEVQPTILIEPEPDTNIPMLIVSEVPSSASDELIASKQSKLKSLKSQDSLELPQIDDRQTFEDIKRITDLKQQTNILNEQSFQPELVSEEKPSELVDVKNEDITNEQHDFVFLTNEDVDELKREEQTYESAQFQKDSLDSVQSNDSSKLLPLLIQLKDESNIDCPTNNTSNTNNEPIIIEQILKPTNSSIPIADAADIEIRRPLLNDDGDLPGKPYAFFLYHFVSFFFFLIRFHS